MITGIYAVFHEEWLYISSFYERYVIEDLISTNCKGACEDNPSLINFLCDNEPVEGQMSESSNNLLLKETKKGDDKVALEKLKN